MGRNRPYPRRRRSDGYGADAGSQMRRLRAVMRWRPHAERSQVRDLPRPLPRSPVGRARPAPALFVRPCAVMGAVRRVVEPLRESIPIAGVERSAPAMTGHQARTVAPRTKSLRPNPGSAACSGVRVISPPRALRAAAWSAGRFTDCTPRAGRRGSSRPRNSRRRGLPASPFGRSATDRPVIWSFTSRWPLQNQGTAS